MTQDKKDYKADKIGLIYEFNNNSPLFVRVAQTSLAKMEVDDAIKVLEKGLELYPYYPSAYIVYGKALAIKGNMQKAVDMITKASGLINSKSTLDFYLKEIEKIAAEYSQYNGSVGEDFVPETFESPTDEDKPRTDSNIKSAFAFSDLDKLTEQISKAKMPRVTGMVEIKENEEYEFDDNKIVSETLAGIYFAQGNFEEALEIYKELKIQNPGRADIFAQRITEIEERIKNKES